MSDEASTTKVPLKDLMPETAKWVAQQRELHGNDWVTHCIRRAKAGEPGHFYALEAGHVLGTPFPASHPFHAAQQYAVMYGIKFAGFIAQPSKRLYKDSHGTH